MLNNQEYVKATNQILWNFTYHNVLNKYKERGHKYGKAQKIATKYANMFVSGPNSKTIH